MTYAATQGVGAKEREASFFLREGSVHVSCVGAWVCVCVCLGTGVRVGVCVCASECVCDGAGRACIFGSRGDNVFRKLTTNVGQM